jgi:hypothetical protein
LAIVILEIALVEFALELEFEFEFEFELVEYLHANTAVNTRAQANHDAWGFIECPPGSDGKSF